MDILVALDDSEPAWDALEYALSEYPAADLTLLHVVNPYDVGYGEAAHFGAGTVVDEKCDEADELFETASERAADHEGSVTTETVVGAPAREVVDYAAENAIDHVIVGSHGRSGVSRVLLGSVAETVTRRAPVPVTVVR
ncbi:universal stress protein [Natribaculum luteum]|uniref:Universal stress protein n=1 Tax=Natribaculum luteum TaxID=1586232 RepID=A0ABD5P3W3_9EURY|nr:universal stress protein [Natribaculum luteum]